MRIHAPDHLQQQSQRQLRAVQSNRYTNWYASNGVLSRLIAELNLPQQLIGMHQNAGRASTAAVQLLRWR
jgi:hypothetical protein